MNFLRLALLIPLLLSTCLAVNKAPDIARRHTLLLGGNSNIKALSSFKAKGQILIDGHTLNIVCLARKPNLVRNEINSSGHLVIQGFDGANPPWQFDANSLQSQTLTGRSAAEFIADAEFSDPLIDATERGFTLAYVGRHEWEGNSYECIAATRTDSDPLELWLDSQTLMLRRQIKIRKLADNRQTRLETRFSDYRRVAGVLLPFSMAVYAEGKKLHEMQLTSVDANPPSDLQLFTQPRSGSSVTPLQ